MQLEGMKVLVAEDNSTNLLVVLQMLESLGAAVVSARDGAEAMDVVRQDRFDVLLIDIEMPKLSGLEVIRRLRADPALGGGAALIALTAYATPRQRAEILAAGADGVITKPIISIEEFGREIRVLA